MPPSIEAAVLRQGLPALPRLPRGDQFGHVAGRGPEHDGTDQARFLARHDAGHGSAQGEAGQEDAGMVDKGEGAGIGQDRLGLGHLAAERHPGELPVALPAPAEIKPHAGQAGVGQGPGEPDEGEVFLRFCPVKP